MKTSNKILHLLIIFFLSSCVGTTDKKDIEKSNNKCVQKSEDRGEIRIIHKSFIERINPTNAFGSIIGGILADINDMNNELNKNNSNQEQEAKTSDHNDSCK